MYYCLFGLVFGAEYIVYMYGDLMLVFVFNVLLDTVNGLSFSVNPVTELLISVFNILLHTTGVEFVTVFLYFYHFSLSSICNIINWLVNSYIIRARANVIVLFQFCDIFKALNQYFISQMHCFHDYSHSPLFVI